MAEYATIDLGPLREKDWFGKKIANAALEAVAETQEEVFRLFNATTAQWHHKPTFEKTPLKMERYKVSAAVRTTDENYCRINYGTPPRVIVSSGKLMSFQPGFIAKSRPRTIGSAGGSRSGKKIVRRKVGTVKKHEIKAREFDKKIKQEADALLKQNLDKSLKEWKL